MRGANPALRNASSLADPVLVGVDVGVDAAAVGVPAGVAGVVAPVVPDGLIVVGVPGLSVPPGVLSVFVGAIVVELPGVTAPVVVGSAVVGSVLGRVIVVVTGAGCAVVDDPPLRSTSEAASTPSASVAIVAIAMIGAFQFAGAASLVRAAAPQLRHHSCAASRGEPHSGHAASTGGPA